MLGTIHTKISRAKEYKRKKIFQKIMTMFLRGLYEGYLNYA